MSFSSIFRNSAALGILNITTLLGLGGSTFLLRSHMVELSEDHEARMVSCSYSYQNMLGYVFPQVRRLLKAAQMHFAITRWLLSYSTFSSNHAELLFMLFMSRSYPCLKEHNQDDNEVALTKAIDRNIHVSSCAQMSMFELHNSQEQKQSCS